MRCYRCNAWSDPAGPRDGTDVLGDPCKRFNCLECGFNWVKYLESAETLGDDRRPRGAE